MDDRDTTRRRAIDRAAGLFRPAPNSEGLYTTAHGAICAKHLAAIGDIERAGCNMWRRKTRPVGRPPERGTA